MPKLHRLVLLLAIAALAAVSTGGAVMAHAVHSNATKQAAKPLVIMEKTKLGKILAGPNGHTLYRYEPESTSSTSKCTGECLATWPPLLLPAKVTKPKGGKGVVDTLGVATRPDVSSTAKQVTYDGWRLYYFIGDKKKGQVKGQNSGGFFVVPTVPTVKFHVEITTTGITWGRVSITGRYHGKNFSQTCSQASCKLNVHAGLPVTIGERETDSSSWPFQSWQITSADGGVNEGPTTSSVQLTSNDSYTVSAEYVLAG